MNESEMSNAVIASNLESMTKSDAEEPFEPGDSVHLAIGQKGEDQDA